MIPRTSVLAFAILSAAPLTAAAADATPGTVWVPGGSATVHPARTLGPTLALGLGAQTAGLGGQVALDVPVTSRWVVAPWVGVGRVPTLFGPPPTMVNGGVMGKYGADDLRLVVDASFVHFVDGSSSSSTNGGATISTTTRRFWAVGQIGGEVMTPYGLFLRVLAGATAGPSNEGVRVAAIGSALVGMKLF